MVRSVSFTLNGTPQQLTVDDDRSLLWVLRGDLRVTSVKYGCGDDRCGACAVVATVGTTSSAAVDPIAAIADKTVAEGVWLHVDAAYAGAAAVCPELRHHFAGWERADSIGVNPHKWLFTPMDCSVFFCRRPDDLRRAFSLVPEYLRVDEDVVSLSEYASPLGRRFRALKLWATLLCCSIRKPISATKPIWKPWLPS